MQLVERHIVKKTKEIHDLCFGSARLYNYVNYYLRQSYFGNVEKFGEYEISKLCTQFNQEDYRGIPPQCSQQTIKLLFNSWKTFRAGMKDYNKNPEKYTARPNIPKYKNKKGCHICVFTNTQARLKNGYIRFPDKTKLPNLITKVDNVCQVRIVPKASCFVIEVVYEQKEIINHEVKKENFLSLDLGIDNLATSINNVGLKPFIVNGKVLKSVNQMYNKSLSELRFYVGKGTSNRIKKLVKYRNNFIEDKMHKISRYIVDYCDKNKIGTIIIGYNKWWKLGVNMKKETNQSFTCIPHLKFIQKIQYKAFLKGIDVVIHEESYTSKIDHFAYEELKHQEEYLGKRKRRGLFQSSTKVLINGDIQGAIGIARKVVGDGFIKGLVNSGCALQPYRVNVV